MDIFEEIVELRRAGRRGALATIVNARGSIPSFESAKMLVRDDGTINGTIGGGCVEAEVWQAAREVMEEEKPRTLTFNLNHDPKYDTGLVCGGTLEIYLEPILPVQTVYLFGAGHVSVNVYRAARMAGFEYDRIGPLEDAIGELSGWYAFSDAAKRDQDRWATSPEDAGLALADTPLPFVDPFKDVGRNDPCPCGSGKKYKKCCLGRESLRPSLPGLL